MCHHVVNASRPLLYCALAAATIPAAFPATTGRAPRRGSRRLRPAVTDLNWHVGRRLSADTSLIGNYPSPDRRYIAHVTLGEAEVASLVVLSARTRRRVLRSRYDITSLIWLPRSRHRLAVATAGVYGHAGMYLWDGGRRWRSLIRVRRPEDEIFRIHGATADGRLLDYGHDPDFDASSRDSSLPDPSNARHWLRLPPLHGRTRNHLAPRRTGAASPRGGRKATQDAPHGIRA